MTRRLFGFAVFAVLAVSLSLSTVASAQTFDHLKCYKMKDPHNFTAVANLTPFQNPPFPLEPGCKIKVKGTEFCIPVDKALVPGTSTAPSAPVVGQPLQNDYICYVMRCPRPTTAIPSVLVSDQFGSRTLQKFVAHRICTPAIKGLPNPCSLDTAGNCNGTCPTTGDTCLYDATTGACNCGPASAQCALDINGTCSGLCPNANNICLPNSAGGCSCQQQLPACNLATFPACNGTCTGGQVCEKDVTTSFCYCCGLLGVSCVTTADCCGGFTCIGGTCQ